MKKKIIIQINEEFSTYTHIDHYCVIVHDPQPLPLISFYKKVHPWIWRCHVDLSHPTKELWDFLKSFVLTYDVEVVSHKNYSAKLAMQRNVIRPGIDPLSSKNLELTDKEISKYLNKFKIPTDKPLITQVSRFDKWKDPVGVINIYELLRKKIDCRLVLCGNMASDDPEGLKIFEQVRRKGNHLIEKGDLILSTLENNILVNALQRKSKVIIQKSLREGFGLTVTEAMWKETPVVASNVGGIPLQIEDGENGFLIEPNDIETFAEKIVEIFKKPQLAEKIGKEAKETVRQNFLITRILQDYLDLLSAILG